jgi:SAM-dependent methyltransferase
VTASVTEELVLDDEIRRVRSVYARYDGDPGEQAKRERENPGLVAIRFERDRALKILLDREQLSPLDGKRILDVGCGRGDDLAGFCGAGASPGNCVGVDVLPDRIESARTAHPEIEFVIADGRRLPFDGESFDLVFAYLVFSSILDRRVAFDLATEMRRLVAPGGAIIWWDNRFPTPGNRDVRGYDLRSIASLFPGWRMRARALTLLPPLARRLGWTAQWSYGPLCAIPMLRARYLCVLRPPLDKPT